MAECASLSKKDDAGTGEDTSLMEGEALINRLPDTVLLEIFSKLTFADLCRCAGVCRMWYRLSKDYSLLRVIRIYGPISRQSTFNLVHEHFSDQIRVFEIYFRRCHPEFMREDPTSFQVGYIDRQIMDNIQMKGTNIKKLVFNQCKFDVGVTLGNLPSTTTHLSLRNSILHFHQYPHGFFTPNESSPKLTCLDMSHAAFLTSQDLIALNSLTSLKALFFQGCSRINNGGIDLLSPILPNLEVLDIEGTEVSDEGVSILLQKCVKMKCLYLAGLNLKGVWWPDLKKNAMTELEHLCIPLNNRDEDIFDLWEKRPTKLLIRLSHSIKILKFVDECKVSDVDWDHCQTLDHVNITFQWKKLHNFSHYSFHSKMGV